MRQVCASQRAGRPAAFGPRAVCVQASWPSVSGGVFALFKSATEHRVISDLPVNDLIDPGKLPRPRFAYPPRLRVLRIPPGSVVTVRKRDARHYFHHLRVGRRWHKFLCHPIVTFPDGRRRAPLHCATPMGFSPSAGWAQAVNDTVAERASLPQDRGVVFDRPAPLDPPIWGSIFDDMWSTYRMSGTHVLSGS